MNIVMLEPLGVSEDVMRAAAAPLLAAGHTLEYCGAPLTDEKKREAAARADIAIIANGKLTSDVIEAGDHMKLLAVGFTGVDHVDLDACKKAGIRVVNASGYATDATAELALALTLSCLRHLDLCDAQVRGGKTRAGVVHHTLRGKTVGIVGTGAIGCRFAALLAPFGCRVLGFARHESERAKALGIEFVPLDELVSQSDVVSLHVPLTDETRHMIDARRLKLMKKDAVLVNCARGAVVDSAALAEALNKGELAAAGLDVFETEPPIAADHPLLHAKNAILAPHVGFFSEESLALRAEIVCDNIKAFLDGAPKSVIL